MLPLAAVRPKGIGPLSTAFSPTSLFTTDIGDWWNPSDLSSVFQDTAGTIPAGANDPVARINGKARAHNLLQSTNAKRPTLKTAGGLWWLEFDGVSQSIGATFTCPEPATLIHGARQIAWADGSYLWCGAANVALYQTGSSPHIVIYNGANGPDTAAATVGTDICITEVINGASSKLAVNNGAYATGNAGTTFDPGGMTVGSYLNMAAAFSNIRWYGGVSIGRVLTDPEIANCRTFFGAKAGLSL